MLRRIQAVLPSHQSQSKIPPSPQNDGDAIFIIANNKPQPVNRIQVQSASNDVEPEREVPDPEPGHSRGNELPLVNGIQHTIGSDDHVMQPHTVQLELPDDQTHPTNTPQHDQPVSQAENEQRRLSTLDDIGVELPEAGENSQHGTPPPGSATPPHVELHSSPTFLKIHFDMMYYLGISPINGDGERGTTVQQVAFSIVTSIALLFTFARCKLFIVDQVEKGDLQDYVTAWFYISRLILQLGFVFLVVFRHRRISAMLVETKTDKPGIRYKETPRKISPFSVLFGGLVIITALLDTAQLAGIISGQIRNLKECILTHSHMTSMLLFLWKKETNGTDTYDVLYSQYGEEVTATTMSMGIFGMVMTFIGSLQENAIKDILLMSALHTLRLSQIFQSNMIKAANESPAGDQLTSQLRNIHNHLSEMASQTESCFGKFFKLVHAHNLLYCGFLLAYLLDDNVNGAYVFEGVVKLLKITFILYCPTNAIETTQEVKSVIRKKYCSDACPNDVNLKQVMLFIQTLEECPISIGRGNFLIDETFSLKFIGAVVTFFFFLMESDKETRRKRRR